MRGERGWFTGVDARSCEPAMMGTNHAQMGLLAGVVSVPVAPVDGLVGQLAWVVAWGGFSLLPDLDQSGSAVSLMWGPVTDLASGVVGGIAGGHREGTHDLVLAPLVAFGVFSGLVVAGTWGQMLAIALSIGLMLRGLSLLDIGRVGFLGNVFLSWSGAWALVSAGQVGFFAWVPWVAAGGVIVHCLGDLPTMSGIPVPLARLLGVVVRLLSAVVPGDALGALARWLESGPRMRLRLFSTGKSMERWVVSPALGLVLVLALSWRTGISSIPEFYAGVEMATGEVGRAVWPWAVDVLTGALQHAVNG